MHTFDRVPHHFPAYMIRVIVSRQHTGKLHVISGEHIDNALHVIGRINGNRFAGLAISDEIDEIHHLTSKRVVLSDVSAGEELTEIETVGSGGISHGDILAFRGHNWRVNPQNSGTSMVPPSLALPDVLPTDRLNEGGMAIGPLRVKLRRLHPWRNSLNVAIAWAEPTLLLALACWWTPSLPVAAALAVWIIVFFLMGRTFARLSILGHEAAHRLLFGNKRLNDFVGAWFCDYPAFVPYDAYRRQHMAHHRDELGANEPDLNLYRGYPITRASMRRKLQRDAFGSSGWKNFRGLLLALTRQSSRPYALRIVAVQLVLFVLMGLLSGRWWLWAVMWLAPWLTVWRVLNRLRGIAEHGGMEHSSDRRRTTHVVRQTWLARMWIVPFNTGWHLAHHADMGVPFQQLPQLHDELVASGWVTPEIEYRSYRALWNALSGG